MGRVYRAIQHGPQGFSRDVAIKVLRHHDEALVKEADEMMAREARIGARLQHRNIVDTLEYTREKGAYMLVMELVEGVTLKALLREAAGALPPWVALGVSAELARGLQHARGLTDKDGVRLGIVRDVKPSNVLISQRGEVKLSDFGLAKMSLVRSDHRTETGVMKGTPGYMSPEQREGLKVGAPGDVYALAVVLRELFTGERPSERRDIDPAQLELPHPALTEIVRRGLNPSPSRRPEIDEVVDVLQRLAPSFAPEGASTTLAGELAARVARIASDQRTPHVVVATPDGLPATPGEERSTPEVVLPTPALERSTPEVMLPTPRRVKPATDEAEALRSTAPRGVEAPRRWRPR